MIFSLDQLASCFVERGGGTSTTLNSCYKLKLAHFHEYIRKLSHYFRRRWNRYSSKISILKYADFYANNLLFKSLNKSHITESLNPFLPLKILTKMKAEKMAIARKMIETMRPINPAPPLPCWNICAALTKPLKPRKSTIEMTISKRITIGWRIKYIFKLASLRQIPVIPW